MTHGMAKKLKPGVFIREVGRDDSHLSLALLVGSEIYQRARREFHSIAIANQVPSLEEFFSEDSEYLRCQGLTSDDMDAEYSFSPDAIVESLKILQDHYESQDGRIGTSKTAFFLADLLAHVMRIGAVGNRFRLILEPGGFV